MQRKIAIPVGDQEIKRHTSKERVKGNKQRCCCEFISVVSSSTILLSPLATMESTKERPHGAL
jgi:hypothetical protein